MCSPNIWVGIGDVLPTCLQVSHLCDEKGWISYKGNAEKSAVWSDIVAVNAQKAKEEEHTARGVDGVGEHVDKNYASEHLIGLFC